MTTRVIEKIQLWNTPSHPIKLPRGELLYIFVPTLKLLSHQDTIPVFSLTAGLEIGELLYELRRIEISRVTD